MIHTVGASVLAVAIYLEQGFLTGKDLLLVLIALIFMRVACSPAGKPTD